MFCENCIIEEGLVGCHRNMVAGGIPVIQAEEPGEDPLLHGPRGGGEPNG